MKRQRDDGRPHSSTEVPERTTRYDVHFLGDDGLLSPASWLEWSGEGVGPFDAVGLQTSTGMSRQPALSSTEVEGRVVWVRLSKLTGAPSQPASVGGILMESIHRFLLTAPVLANGAGNEDDVRRRLVDRYTEFSPYPSLTSSQLDVVDVFYLAVRTGGGGGNATVPWLVSVMGFARNARPNQHYMQLFLTAVVDRRRGVGRGLLRVALQSEFAVAPTSAVWLHTMQPLRCLIDESDTERANGLVRSVHGLYEGMGFRVRRMLKGYYAHPVEDLRLCMVEAHGNASPVTRIEDALMLAGSLQQRGATGEVRAAGSASSTSPELMRGDAVEMVLTRGDYMMRMRAHLQRH